MNQTVYEMLQECTAMANVIEAAENGYVALNDNSIEHLKKVLYKSVSEVLAAIEKEGAMSPRPLTPPYKPFGIRRFNQLNK